MSAMQDLPNLLPMLFRFRDLVGGSGFVAEVATEGRVLFVRDDDGEAWMYGVNPGGLAGGGGDRADAWLDFKNSYLSILYDVAAEADSFADFKREVESFFHQTNKPREAEWNSALEAVRRDGVTLTDIPSVSADEQPSKVEVVLLGLQQTTPAVNELDLLQAAA